MGRLAMFVLLTLLGACSTVVSVPVAEVPVTGTSTSASGRYAAMIQSNDWGALETKPVGYVCGGWKFTTDVNSSYRAAMQTVLTRSLEHVDFVDAPLSPSDLKARGYDAFFALRQGNGAAKFGVTSNIWVGTGPTASEVELITTLDILDERGPYYQQTIRAKGTGDTDAILVCSTIGKGIAHAAREAVIDLAQKSILYIRDGVRERQLKKFEAGRS